MTEGGPRPDRPFVMALTGDLFLVPGLEDAARAAGYDLRVVARPEDLGAGGAPSPRSVPLTEPLEGPEAVLVRGLVTDRPALILVDLASSSIPWERWIAVIKSSAATRRIPIVAFGPHVAEKDLARAERAGADRTLPRGAFLGSAADQIEKYASKPDTPAILSSCGLPISDLARHGLELLNQGEFFEAHETLEHAWISETGSGRELLRSLIQVAVAYLQMQRGNRRGAQKILLRLRQWLDPLPSPCRGVDVDALRRQMETFRDLLASPEDHDAAEVIRLAFHPIPWMEGGPPRSTP